MWFVFWVSFVYTNDLDKLARTCRLQSFIFVISACLMFMIWNYLLPAKCGGPGHATQINVMIIICTLVHSLCTSNVLNFKNVKCSRCNSVGEFFCLVTHLTFAVYPLICIDILHCALQQLSLLVEKLCSS